MEILSAVIQSHCEWREASREQLLADAALLAAWAGEVKYRQRKAKGQSPPSDDASSLTPEGPGQETAAGKSGQEGGAAEVLEGEDKPKGDQDLPPAEEQQRMEELQLRNRVVFHSLGALEVMAVDADARARWIQV